MRNLERLYRSFRYVFSHHPTPHSSHWDYSLWKQSKPVCIFSVCSPNSYANTKQRTWSASLKHCPWDTERYYYIEQNTERAGEHYTDLSVVLRPIWSPLVNKIQWNKGQFYWEVGGQGGCRGGEQCGYTITFKGQYSGKEAIEKNPLWAISFLWLFNNLQKQWHVNEVFFSLGNHK